MKHYFQKGTNSSKPVLLLLHGTGGNEHSLLQLAEMIDPEAPVLSVRGNVLEHGMPRFFKRLSEGVFDLEDLEFRTKELSNFLDEAAKEHDFDRKNIVAVGYSNGANIAASLLFYFEKALQGAILFHPMVPRRDLNIPSLKNTPIFIGAGTNDPLIRTSETEELKTMLEEKEANVTMFWDHYGHQLTEAEVMNAVKWYRENFS
ncbi:alpha/beta hydrolase [Heyndrickxia sporothermodurans]|uniref:alpha/beta hydrolase n=1 Tax=Heyndrickxia TaxID=2837504 RepID=UPI000D3DB55B|nr:alpha/beta hydrolase [Heyndrickxia sporothermodurans]MEB6549812.1 alpha/beta hydrolase [Heyndrickxia sporothermodurans]PTY77332.1 carboxylesterase [Heyndrickxia sporothermodurans]